MHKRVQIALAVLLVAIAGVIAWLATRLQEPAFQGRPLIDWIQEGMSGGLQRDVAIVAVTAAGTNAFPIYVQWLETPHDSRLKIKVDYIISKVPLLRHSRHYSYEIRRVCGSAALNIWGENAKPLIPILTHLLETGDIHQRTLAAGNLAGIGLAAIQPLTNCLSNSNAYTRAIAAEALGAYASTEEDFWSKQAANRQRLESCAKVIVPILIPCLKDESQRVQVGVIQSLGRFARDPEIVVPLLTEIVQNGKDKMVRYSALVALQNYQARAESVISAVVQALRDPDLEVRSRAAIFLNLITNSVAKP